MDGNGRWAQERNLPRSFGHLNGAKNIDRVVNYLQDIGVKYLTLFAFSTENWKRSKDEVEFLMSLFRKRLKKVIQDRNQNVKINIIGRKSKLSRDIVSLAREVESYSKNNNKLILNIAIDYGSREEIVKKKKKIFNDILNNKISIDDLDENMFNNYLYTNGTPDVDLFIRTAGERRMSNFLLWQSSYAEFVSVKTLWPDFSQDDIDYSIEEFNKRTRKFGSVN